MQGAQGVLQGHTVSFEIEALCHSPTVVDYCRPERRRFPSTQRTRCFLQMNVAHLSRSSTFFFLQSPSFKIGNSKGKRRNEKKLSVWKNGTKDKTKERLCSQSGFFIQRTNCAPFYTVCRRLTCDAIPHTPCGRFGW